ncbi:hypothetical protein T12_7488 [Trichinella patagoniensis]|uniref:Uncharacterized protein n=1 Tax=Trichinella patagoniensis TaxID=990121 RepID=A0A0V1A1S8_9BILA|nr:hypothetical protein T12_7488 [Trichinella patagoniensis]
MFALNSSANSLLPDNVVNEKPTLAADQSTTYLILQANLSTPCNNTFFGLLIVYTANCLHFKIETILTIRLIMVCPFYCMEKGYKAGFNFVKLLLDM